MKLLVDTNVWVDLDNAGLLSVAMQAEFEFVIPDILLRELKDISLPNTVEVRSSDAHELARVVEVRSLVPALSMADAVLFVAVQAEELRLVTGDAQLRRYAESQGIPTCGVIWLVDQLVAQDVLPPAEAADALEEMVSAGARLPQQEVVERVG